jgi:CRP-like cAMP-binding protein
MPKTADKLLWQLEKFDLLEGLDQRQLEKLSSWVKDQVVSGGESIYLPGEPSEAIYFLKWGRVKLSHVEPDGRELTVSIFEKGEPFGEMALLKEERRSLRAEALEESRLCWLSKGDFLEFAREAPSLSLNIAKLIGFRRRKIENQLENLVFKDVPTRLARTLLELGEEHGTRKKRGTKIGPRFTHKDLANLIGSTRETTTATLNGFEKEGIIEKGWASFLILDEAKLREKAKLG